MKIHDKLKQILVGAYGEFNSKLENDYEKLLTEKLLNDKKTEWATYNQVIVELRLLKNKIKLQELQYRLTDNENPNKVIINILDSIKPLSPELQRLYNKITNF